MLSSVGACFLLIKLSALHRYVPAPGQTQKECLRQCTLVWRQQRQQHLWHLGLQRPGTGLHCKYLRGQLIFSKCPELTTSPHSTIYCLFLDKMVWAVIHVFIKHLEEDLGVSLISGLVDSPLSFGKGSVQSWHKVLISRG